MNQEAHRGIAAAVVSRIVTRYGDRVSVEYQRFDEYPTIVEARFVPRAAHSPWVSILVEDFEHVTSVAGFHREYVGSLSEDATVAWLFALTCEIADQGIVVVQGSPRLPAECSSSELFHADQVWRPW